MKVHQEDLSTLRIVTDIPSTHRRYIHREIINLICSARTRIIICTPYFIPDFRVSHDLKKAVKRGVDVKILVPLDSDMPFLDLASSRTFGSLLKRGIQIYLYKEGFVHSKFVVADDTVIMGSANIDYRSFVHNYEICLIAQSRKLAEEMVCLFGKYTKGSLGLSHKEWISRPFFRKVLEAVCYIFREFL